MQRHTISTHPDGIFLYNGGELAGQPSFRPADVESHALMKLDAAPLPNGQSYRDVLEAGCAYKPVWQEQSGKRIAVAFKPVGEKTTLRVQSVRISGNGDITLSVIPTPQLPSGKVDIGNSAYMRGELAHRPLNVPMPKDGKAVDVTLGYEMEFQSIVMPGSDECVRPQQNAISYGDIKRLTR